MAHHFAKEFFKICADSKQIKIVIVDLPHFPNISMCSARERHVPANLCFQIQRIETTMMSASCITPIAEIHPMRITKLHNHMSPVLGNPKRNLSMGFSNATH